MKPYKACVEEGFEVLLPPLACFVETKLVGRYGVGWTSHVADGANTWKECGGNDEKFRKSLDVAACLKTIRNEWQAVFRDEMPHEQRTFVEELLVWRNKLAHTGQEPWERDDAYRALDTMARFARFVGDGACVERITALRDEILRDEGNGEKTVDHPHTGPGGGNLPGVTPMSAAWFVSYMYYDRIDRTHLNWKMAPEYKNWISVYNRSADRRRSYLEEVLEMDDDRLGANAIGLSAKDVKRMARGLLAPEDGGRNPGNGVKAPENEKGRHTFSFPGGGELTTMGAAWFVSYKYYYWIDKTHLNWRRVSTYKNRISVYRHSAKYHWSFLNEILKMNDSNLEKNTIGLSAEDIKRMARELLDMWDGGSGCCV